VGIRAAIFDCYATLVDAEVVSCDPIAALLPADVEHPDHTITSLLELPAILGLQQVMKSSTACT
jgi:FMN phosphatase YigB (HAD superfamily)